MRVFAVLLICMTCRGANWYVSPTGTGNGSIGSPWFLQTALTNALVQPGDTIWLRNGTYFPTTTFLDWDTFILGWHPSINGTSNSLITLRSYTNELAAIDRRWFFKDSSSYLRFLDLEFYDSLKGHNLTNSQYPDGPWVHFAIGDIAGFEWINCVIHDVDNCWGGGITGNSFRGNIIWHVGWNSVEHVCYGPPYNFVGNISAWHYDDLIEHSFTNFLMSSNIVFGTGINKVFSGGGFAGGGGDALVDGGGKVIYNYFYNRFDFIPSNGYPQTLSYIGGSPLTVNSNVISGPTPVTYNQTISNSFVSSFVGNTVYSSDSNYQAPVLSWYGTSGSAAFDYNKYYAAGTVEFNYENTYHTTFSQWQAYNPDFDTHSSVSNSAHPPDSVFVIPNTDDHKRCHVAVYNFSHSDNVSVGVSILNTGDIYQLYSAQNYKLGPIRTGIYNGIGISCPMTNLTTAPVLYGTNVNTQGVTLTTPYPLSPEFAAFIVQGQPGATLNVINLKVETIK